MQFTDSVRTLIASKPAVIRSISPDQTVLDALAMMADYDIGALLVMDDGRLVGIFSERDYARKLVLAGRMSRETRVSEVMSSPVIFVTPDHNIAECMQIMTMQRIRHLPVLRHETVVGMVSIGDLLKWMLQSQEETIRHLESYISGTPSY
jgi:CBS domain-containing protein